MHNVLEDVMQYEAKLLLLKFIWDDKILTLQEFNSKLECFEFGHNEGKSRPKSIEAKTLSSSDNSQKQNGMY